MCESFALFRANEGRPFDFSYEVKDAYKGLDFGHSSDSDGKVVTGKYYVLLPDGRTQIVTYTADDDNGYQAEVRYEGEATYPESAGAYPPAPQETYGAPDSSYEEPQNSYESPEVSYEAPEPLYGLPDN
ncbi:pro-resilin-like [Macrobrachium nipponense]|uniref:pro-resilin-like n=1 Tax=Macrobrachium nipponense TaxID=159736 RepID=UPI0030C8AA76